VLSLEITNALIFFIDLTNRIFTPYLDNFVMKFVNNILMYSNIREEHATHLRLVLRILEEHKLYAKLKKCEFWLEKVHFLSHVVPQEGISMNPTKVEAIVN